MTVSIFFTPKIRKGIVHLIVLLIVVKYLFIPFIFNSDYPARGSNVYTISTIIVSFYIHTFILLPILLKGKKVLKYIIYTVICLIIVGVLLQWFEAVRSSLITFHGDGTPSSPFDFFLTKNWIITGSKALLVSFMPFSLLSVIYYFLLLSEEGRKNFFSFKYIEVIINILIACSLFLFFSFNMVIHQVSMFFLCFSIIVSFFYINTFLITPILLIEKKGGSYLLFLGLLFFSTVLIFKGFYQITQIEFGPFSGRNLFPTILALLIVYVLSFIYGFLRVMIREKTQILNLKLGAKDSELQLLKSQVNPHFLFNTLNTLYATALEEKADRTASSTAKLASLIRYMQEDMSKDFIPLDSEVSYLQDYIEIQKLRCSVEPEVDTRFVNIKHHNISPGLFIPFVENAFKYGIDPSASSSLKVSVICDDRTINFKCVNSYDENFKTYYKEQGFGIGIKNAKQRLELIYNKNHTFEVVKENNIFSVTISIKSQTTK